MKIKYKILFKQSPSYEYIVIPDIIDIGYNFFNLGNALGNIGLRGGEFQMYSRDGFMYFDIEIKPSTYESLRAEIEMLKTVFLGDNLEIDTDGYRRMSYNELQQLVAKLLENNK